MLDVGVKFGKISLISLDLWNLFFRMETWQNACGRVGNYPNI